MKFPNGLPSAGAHTQSTIRASSYGHGQCSEDTHIAAAAAILNLSTRCREATDILSNKPQSLRAKVSQAKSVEGGPARETRESGAFHVPYCIHWLPLLPTQAWMSSQWVRGRNVCLSWGSSSLRSSDLWGRLRKISSLTVRRHLVSKDRELLLQYLYGGSCLPSAGQSHLATGGTFLKLTLKLCCTRHLCPAWGRLSCSILIRPTVQWLIRLRRVEALLFNPEPHSRIFVNTVHFLRD